MEEKNNEDLNPSQKEPPIVTTNMPDVVSTYNSNTNRNQMINGRRYVNVENEDYVLPNNKQELNSISLQHSLLKYAWCNNFSSPIHEALKTGGLKVLDVGCGPGTWLFDMCIDYPLCNFVGLDISLVPSSTSDVNNITFIQSNVLDGLPFKDNTFDFVHQRSWMSSLSMKQWEPLIRELKRVCKVGGWLELLETDMVYYNEGINTRNLRASRLAFFYSKDFFIDVCNHIPQFLESVDSFNEINKEECIIPIGDWAGKIGELCIKTIYEEYKVIYPELKTIMEVNEEEFDEILNRFVKEANENKTYYKTFRFFCRKFM
ncbi:S-adenosyl-L-methionine-dependent methyltransferase [Glomus cerebriforme]|uniref:S-adenosyl-L-methionine-dependent methyltransferase n=1 Tax=Glomus cerebriforme TaxID=658196 RepID=A0A397SUW5_9GLOM|nr:S-adenosyl-L-methionine-dependent methyltransferase [Glomus cerebriforme]